MSQTTSTAGVSGGRILPLLSAGFCFSLVLTVHLALIGYQVHQNLQRDVDDYIHSLDAIFSEINAGFDASRAETAPRCSAAFLQHARQLVFKRNHIRDILVVDADMRPQCSASQGLLADQPPLPKPKLLTWHNNRDIWHALPLALFDGKETSWAIRDADIVIVSNVLADTVMPAGKNWEVRAHNPGDERDSFVRGKEGVSATFTGRAHIPLLSEFGARACSTVEFACITEVGTVAGIWRQHHWQILFGLALATALSLLAYIAGRRWTDLRVAPIGRIARALKTGEGFSCVYQPLVDMRSGKVVGCEVLARFADRCGSIPPNDFVPLIERLDRTWEFSELIFGRAFEELMPLLAERPDLHVSVNFFPRDLEPDNLQTLRKSWALNYAAANRIHLSCEILETGVHVEDGQDSVLDLLRRRGFKIAIDDFGTGASNLQQVHGLKADYIKIDRSFVSGSTFEVAPVRASLIPHIIGIAEAVKAEVIAEGVETFEQLQLMRNMGVRLAQGYFFSHPLPIAEFRHFLTTEHDQLVPKGSASIHRLKT